MQFGIRIYTMLFGKKVGRDEYGNTYYTASRGNQVERRWVIHSGKEEASKVPPLWHAWLHRVTDNIPASTMVHKWQKPHQQNLTGTTQAYQPDAHPLKGGERPKVMGDYESWQPK